MFVISWRSSSGERESTLFVSIKFSTASSLPGSGLVLLIIQLLCATYEISQGSNFSSSTDTADKKIRRDYKVIYSRSRERDTSLIPEGNEGRVKSCLTFNFKTGCVVLNVLYMFLSTWAELAWSLTHTHTHTHTVLMKTDETAHTSLNLLVIDEPERSKVTETPKLCVCVCETFTCSPVSLLPRWEKTDLDFGRFPHL